MRLTIIVPDKTIIIDGEAYSGISTDWSWVPDNIHAVQWYDTWGEVEYCDDTSNERIEELGTYEQAVVCHENEKQRVADEHARIEYEWEWERNWPRILRKLRSIRLTHSDWTQVPDNALTEEEKEAWRVYRQQLSDLPKTITEEQYRELVRDENHELWPTKPD